MAVTASLPLQNSQGFRVQKRGACPSHLQLSPYFFTSNWVLLLESRLSENRAEIFHVPGLRMDKERLSPLVQEAH